MQTAKLFIYGRSQAVRLPEAFRFEGEQKVLIERVGDAVVLRPPHKRSPIEKLIAALDEFEPFPAREQPTKQQKRES